MQAIKSKGSKIELTLGKALWAKGLRYRKNDSSIFGKPDFTFKKYKIAIFCDSEFWHGKNWVQKKHEHKTNVAFWHNKIERNIARDIEVNSQLKSEGWTVLRFWGNEILKNLDFCVTTIEAHINEQKQNYNI
ncbi:MAG: very short patch repair endonuclease [Thiomicrospira sp.]|jgi:DNA mismatch endonuclease Vsr|nr:very short patch repair endonuclease [Thiomicrospira sp.]